MTLRDLNAAGDGRVGFFRPRTWTFWRALITCFCACCLIGHWLEFPYCWMTDSLFGIVDDGYALYIDPWFHPYWCYGFGALGMTLALEPLKGWLVRRRKTMRGAVAESFAACVVLAMLMELAIGLIVNQPDAAGHYPYWDNSQLPFNVGGQAWLFNDVFIGLAAIVYLWVMFPAVCRGFAWLERGSRGAALRVAADGREGQARGEASPTVARGIRNPANTAFACLMAAFCLCCAISYAILAS